MKKIFTILLTLISISSFSQRFCDVEAKLSSPVEGTIVRNGWPVNVTWAFKNLGPDKLMKGDTVTAILSLNNVVYTQLSFGIVLNADVAKDASFLSFNQSINFNYTNAVPQGNLCILAVLRNRIDGNPQVMDSATKNNNSCAMIDIRSNDIKVIGKGLAVATQINALPNPAKNNVSISYTLINPETVTVAIFDMNGRLVINPSTDKQSAGENSMNFDISTLNSGLYFYEVKIGNLSERYKLMVN
jgi:hypothetical protein